MLSEFEASVITPVHSVTLTLAQVKTHLPIFWDLTIQNNRDCLLTQEFNVRRNLENET